MGRVAQAVGESGMEVWGGRKLREKENWPGTMVGVALDRVWGWWERVGGLTRAARVERQRRGVGAGGVRIVTRTGRPERGIRIGRV